MEEILQSKQPRVRQENGKERPTVGPAIGGAVGDALHSVAH